MALNADIDGIVTVVPTEEEAPAAPIRKEAMFQLRAAGKTDEWYGATRPGNAPGTASSACWGSEWRGAARVSSLAGGLLRC